MIREGALVQSINDGGTVGRLGALNGIGQQGHGGVSHEHFIAEELTLRFHTFFEFQRTLVAGVEPVVAIDDAIGGFWKLFHKLVARRCAAEHGVDGFRRNFLLLHGANQQRIFVVVVGRNHNVRVDLLDAQCNVVEVACGVGMLDHFFDVIAIARQFFGQQIGCARAKQRLLVNDHHSACWLACCCIQHVQVSHSHFGTFSVARSKASAGSYFFERFKECVRKDSSNLLQR